MGQKLMLIMNPTAGKGQYRASIPNVLEIFCAHGYIVTVYMTQRAGHAKQLAGDCGGDYDIVVCCGGDGTLHEVISGLMTLRVRPTLGYIPMGTANDVGTTLGIPKNAERAARIITEENTIPFDVGLMDGHYFTYIAAFGAFTEVSYETAQQSKQVLGHLAYILEGLSHFGKINPRRLTVEYDSEKIEDEFIFGCVTNSTSIAGLVKLKSDLVDLGDGLFEVILVKVPKNLADLNNIFMGIITQKYDPEYVMLFQAKEIKFTFEEDVSWTRDGENGGEYQEVKLENIQGGVQLIVPAKNNEES